MAEGSTNANAVHASPRISVVLPAYNSAETLGRAIDSVITQTFTDWELIVVDDGSMDATPLIAADYAAHLGERMRHVRTENRGPGAARNTGIDLARGEFVAFLDADDEFLPDKFSKLIAMCNRRPELGLVFSDYAYVDVAGKRHASIFDDFVPYIWDIPYEPIGDEMRVCGPELLDCMSGRYIISTITGMVRRSVLGDDVRFPEDLRYCEEWLFFLDVCRRTRAGYVAESLALHHHTAGSVSRSSVRRNLEHRIRALNSVRTSAPHLSARARRDLRMQLDETHRQLACDHYKSGAFSEACRHFAMALRTKPDLRTGVNLAQAIWRRVAATAHRSNTRRVPSRG
ncbi:MAG: glycosyltransferase [Phycisphaerales bacterium]|nr:glycosyltransferase [Phycisphaerales bacterium]